jgi:hypothetical protein
MGPMETMTENHVVLVVGYDGTAPARRALLAAAEMLQKVPGRMEVVYVAHMPAYVSLSPQAIASLRGGFDLDEQQLATQVDESLRSSAVKWHFQRRNGEIAPELLAVSEEQLETEGPSTRVVLVVGGSAHKIDRYLNSTPSRVIRQDRFRVLIIP